MRVIDYILSSFVVHLAVILLLLSGTPVSLNTSKTNKDVEVKFVGNPKNSTFLPTPAKSLKSGSGQIRATQHPKIDLKTYADQLKAIVDPVYYSKIMPILNQNNKNLTTIILFFPNSYGRIVSMQVIKSSGSPEIDQVAIDTLNEVGSIPKPPELLVKEGIEWSFITGN